MENITIIGEKHQNVTYQSRLGVYGIVYNEKGQIGLIAVLKPDGEKFFLPGGGLEIDEKHFEGLQREFREELGWKVEVGQKIGENLSYINAEMGHPSYEMRSYFYLIPRYSKKYIPIEVDHRFFWSDLEWASRHLYPPSQAYMVSKICQQSKSIQSKT